MYVAIFSLTRTNSSLVALFLHNTVRQYTFFITFVNIVDNMDLVSGTCDADSGIAVTLSRTDRWLSGRERQMLLPP